MIISLYSNSLKSIFPNNYNPNNPVVIASTESSTSNMGMRIEYTIFLMMRLKSFRPDIDKKLAALTQLQMK
jgi:hypothetical protein